MTQLPFAIFCVASFAGINSALFADEAIEFETHIRPMLEHHCYGCQSNGEKNGNIAFDEIEGDVRQSQIFWHKVLLQLRSKSMPPLGEAELTDEQRTRAMTWIKSEVFRHDPKRPDPSISLNPYPNQVRRKGNIPQSC